MMSCLFCGRTPAQGVDLYRLNKKGEPGLFVCGQHLPRTDFQPTPEVKAIVGMFKRRQP